MNNKEKQIISYLRKNARFTLAYISRMSNIPVSTLFDRIKSYEGKVIRKTTCIVDFEKLGYSTRAKIALKISKSERELMQKFLEEHPNTNSLFKIDNGFDFLVECIFCNLKELNDFIDILNERFKILDLKLFQVIDDIKREAFMAEPIKIAL
jgi:DNA-binding Lrp family transcriptional regulator